jgi:flagellar motor switch protein FliM
VTEKSCKDPAVVSVQGEKKFLAYVGQYRGNRALRVWRGTEPTDRV